jgi:ABC-type lipoprotein release transport system permease subunit
MTSVRTLIYLTKIGLGSRTRSSWIGLVSILVISSSTLVIGLGLRTGGREILNAAATRSHRPDFTIWGRPETLQRIHTSPDLRAKGVLQQSTLRPVTGAEVIDIHGDALFVLATTIAPLGESVNQLHLIAGRRPSGKTVDAHAILVEPRLAAIGEQIKVRSFAGTIEYVVVGHATDFSMCASQCGGPARMFLPPAAFAQSFGTGNATDQALSFTVRDPATFSTTALRRDMHGFHRTLRWTDVQSGLLAPDDITSGFVLGIGLFLLVSSLVVMFNLISAQMIARQREFSILGTIGATPTQLAIAVTAEHAIFVICATTVGWLMASAGGPVTQSALARTLGSAKMHFDFTLLWNVLLAILFASNLIIVTSIVRGASRPIIDAIRQRAISGTVRAHWVRHLPGSVLPIAISETLSRRLRTTTAIIGVAMAVAGTSTAWQLRHTIGDMAQPSKRIGLLWDISVWSITSTQQTEKLATELAGTPGVDHMYTSIQFPGKLTGTPIAVHAQGGDPNSVAYNITSGRAKLHIGEALIGTGAARRAGLRIGDTAEITVRGQQISSHIVGMFRDINNGKSIIVRLEQVRSVDPTAPAGSLHLRLKAGANRRASFRFVQHLTAGRAQSVLATRTGSEVYLARRALAIVGALISILAFGQLGTSSLIGAKENRREIAVLGAVGFTRRQLCVRGGIGVALAGTIGALIAIPLSAIVFRTILTRTLRRASIEPDIVDMGIGVGHSPVGFMTFVSTILLCGVVGMIAARIAIGTVTSKDLAST